MGAREGGSRQTDHSINAVVSVKLGSYDLEAASGGVGTELGTDRHEAESASRGEKKEEHHRQRGRQQKVTAFFAKTKLLPSAVTAGGRGKRGSYVTGDIVRVCSPSFSKPTDKSESLE